MLVALIVTLVLLVLSMVANGILFWRVILLASDLLELEGRNRARLPTEDRIQEP